MALVNRTGQLQERDLAISIQLLKDGKINSTGTFTLTASATSTVVADLRVGPASVILLMPTTANSAGAISTTYVSSRGKQTFTLTHSNAASVDRDFDYVVLG